MGNLVERLRDWQHVHPEDEDKPEGHLYEVAADRIEELQSRLRWVITERDDTFVRMLRRVETAEAKLAKALEALGAFADDTNWFDAAEEDGTFYPAWRGAGSPEEIARTALKELTEGKHD